MTVSRYPRKGDPIAPKALGEALVVLLPAQTRTATMQYFRDLGEDAWNIFPESVCISLGKALIQVVGPPQGLDDCIREQMISVPDDMQGLPIGDLELEPRTSNALQRSGLKGELGLLHGTSIGDMLEIRFFGIKCLVDLLASLEGVGVLCVSAETDFSRLFEAKDLSLRTVCQELTIQAVLAEEQESILSIRKDDPRFGRLLKAIPPSAAGELKQKVDFLVKRGRDPRDPEKAAKNIELLRLKAVGCVGMTLEEELFEIIQSVAGNLKRFDLVVSRLGWDGLGVKTLQDVANDNELTRQRVQQIEAVVINRLTNRSVYAPVLDRALEMLLGNIPCLAESIETSLREGNITKGQFDATGLVTAIDVLRPERNLCMAKLSGIRLLVHEDQRDYPRIIRNAVIKTAAEFGASTTEQVEFQVHDQYGIEVDAELIASIAETINGFTWLDKQAGWYWRRAKRGNRLANQIRKVMAVSERIEIGELREGVCRHHRMSGFVVPKAVLLEVCNQLSDYVVEGDVVRASPPIDWKVTLDGVEYEIARILFENGGILDRGALEELCCGAGINQTSFYMYIGYSPVVKRYAPSIYGLRGFRISPAQMQNLLKERRTGKVLIDYGWTDGQNIWVGYKVSPNMLATGIFSIPAAMSKYLSYFHYSLSVGEGLKALSIRTEKYTGWNIRTALVRRGVQVGDYLVLVFNLRDKTVQAHSGGEELLVEYQHGC